ncbi:MAG: phosphoglucomutase/phosphomannomutase family protein [Chloroflexi bacterium]|nr:phosphoglucomutase/phosphomannomutase family protein [Chloroflexota bacterium]
MSIPIKFGTDGWRAIIADDFTFENVRLCAQALCNYLKRAGKTQRGLVVGYDTRYASERFAAAAAEVVAANGISVYLCGKACPTPVVSHTIRHLGADGGVVITASHNPGEYNGFKVKDEHSSSAPQEVVDRIEAELAELWPTKVVRRMPLEEATGRGLARSVDPDAPYLETIRRLVGEDRLQRIRSSGMRVVVDSMYGAGAGYLRALLRGGGVRVTELNGVRNPAFPGIQPEPITRNLAKLRRHVRRGASVGLATDGDADRLGVMDEHGSFVTQLQVYALLCLYLLEVRGQRGPLIKTITTSSMIYRLGERYNVPVVETDVGFKYVGPEMIRLDALIGGEESGGYGFRGHIPERDGILAGLYFLDLMVSTGKSPSQLVEHLYSLVGPHYYDRLDLHFPPDQRSAIIGRVAGERKAVGAHSVAHREAFGSDGALNGVRFTFADAGWLLVRFSGTEPVLRIYAETSSPQRVAELLQRGRELAGL